MPLWTGVFALCTNDALFDQYWELLGSQGDLSESLGFLGIALAAPLA